MKNFMRPFRWEYDDVQRPAYSNSPDLYEDLSRLRKYFNHILNDFLRVEDGFKVLRESIDSMVPQLEEEMNRRFQEVEDIIRGVEIRFSEKIVKLDNRITILEKRADKTDEKIKEIFKNIGEINTELSSIHQAITNIINRLDGIDGDIKQIRGRLDGIDKSIDDIRARLDDIDTSIDEIIKKFDNYYTKEETDNEIDKKRIHLYTSKFLNAYEVQDASQGEEIRVPIHLLDTYPFTDVKTKQVIKTADVNVLQIGDLIESEDEGDGISSLPTLQVDALHQLLVSIERFEGDIIYCVIRSLGGVKVANSETINNIDIVKQNGTPLPIDASDKSVNVIADANVIEIVKQNGVVLQITDKYVDVNAYTKEEVNEIIKTINQMDIKIVDELPTENISTTTIYLILKDAEEANVYDEYIYVNGEWELIGSTKTDLSDYYTKSQIDEKLDALPAAGEKNVIEIVKQNGTALQVTDKAVNVDAYTKAEVDNRIPTDVGQNNIIEVVQQNNVPLPVQNKTVNVDAYSKEEVDSKITNIPPSGDKNVIEIVKQNGVELDVINKAVDIDAYSKEETSDRDESIYERSTSYTDNKILSGTAEPTAEIGKDDDIYIKYE